MEREPVIAALIPAVSERLRWNVAAYGKAWTGEYEDTTFIVKPLIDVAEAASEYLKWSLLAGSYPGHEKYVEAEWLEIQSSRDEAEDRLQVALESGAANSHARTEQT